MRVHRVVIGLVAGLIVGSILGAWSGDVASWVVAVLNPIGQLWVNAIRMTIVPLVVSLLFVSVASRESSEGFGRLGLTTLVTFLALLVFAALVALVLVPPLMADMKLAPDVAAALRSTATTDARGAIAQVTQLPGFGAWVTALVPANAVKAAADGAMLPLIVFAFVFALAARQIEPALRQSLVDFFGAIAGAMTRLVGWVIAVAPIGVFSLVVVAASRVGVALAGAMAYYILAVSAALVLFTMLMYPVAAIVGRLHPGAFARGVLPAQAVALSSSSSLASLPALVEGSRRLGLPVQVSGFVLPLAVSTFKVATPITWLVGVTFLARLYGVTLGLPALVTIALTCVALSLTIPGVPQGAVLLVAPLLTTYGIPVEGVALLLAADTIPDLVGTMTNVTGDLVVGAIVGRQPVADIVPQRHHPSMRDGDFRIRGREISRVEGLSDAVFGFAITLLVISLEVPKTSSEVLHAMRGFFAFAITFSLLFAVWRTQFTFFRRYGLEDNTTVNLNAVLLFVILFFVYPLKFVFGAVMERVLARAGFPDPTVPNLFNDEHASLLVAIYLFGWMAVFGVFALLHRHAYSKREALKLTAIEEFDTRESIKKYSATAFAGLMLGAANIAAYRAPNERAAARINLLMAAALVGFLALVSRLRRQARRHRRELVAGAAAGTEA